MWGIHTTIHQPQAASLLFASVCVPTSFLICSPFFRSLLRLHPVFCLWLSSFKGLCSQVRLKFGYKTSAAVNDVVWYRQNALVELSSLVCPCFFYSVIPVVGVVSRFPAVSCAFTFGSLYIFWTWILRFAFWYPFMFLQTVALCPKWSNLRRGKDKNKSFPTHLNYLRHYK